MSLAAARMQVPKPKSPKASLNVRGRLRCRPWTTCSILASQHLSLMTFREWLAPSKDLRLTLAGGRLCRGWAFCVGCLRFDDSHHEMSFVGSLTFVNERRKAVSTWRESCRLVAKPQPLSHQEEAYSLEGLLANVGSRISQRKIRTRHAVPS